MAVGRIFEAYRAAASHGIDDDPFEDDDEVAVVHGPPESGYRGVSEAMVEHPAARSARADEEGLIARATCRAFVAEAKAAFFPDRGYVSLLAQGARRGCPNTSSPRSSAGCPPVASTRSAATR